MNPAQAMGTFLKTWRSEWAGLSRRQLAIAVSALLNSKKTVSPTIIREWEDGQPPKTTEEFEALCQVMRRNGLTTREADHFSQSVFFSFAGRQYPELFADDELLRRPDIDEVAYQLLSQAPQSVYPTSAVHLVSLIHSLERETRDLYGSADRRSVLVRQWEALCCLRLLLGNAHAHAGRLLLAADLFATNATFLLAFFGAGACLNGDERLTVLGQRLAEGSTRLAAAQADDRGGGLRRRAAGRLLNLAEEAEACGEPRIAQRAVLTGSDPEDLGESAYTVLRARLEAAAAEASPGAGTAHSALVGVMLGEGLLDWAEQHLQTLEDHRNDGPTARCLWLEAAGRMALATGDLAQAQEYFEAGEGVARDDELVWFEAVFRRRESGCGGA